MGFIQEYVTTVSKVIASENIKVLIHLWATAKRINNEAWLIPKMNGDHMKYL
jgi:hypothetical protein